MGALKTLRTIAMLALCGIPAFTADASAAESRLASSAIRKLLVGHTVTILTPGRKMAPLEFARGGMLRTTNDGAKAAGKWSIKVNHLCLDIAGTVGHGCMAVVRHDGDSKRLFLFTTSGEPFGELILDSRAR